MVSNQEIELELKRKNLWFHTNYYFVGKVQKINSIEERNKKYLINLTENDIIIIPCDYHNDNILLDSNGKTEICSGDVEKVAVTHNEMFLYTLDVNLRDGSVIKIDVDLYNDKLQRQNIIRFVENFKNEGAETLYRKEFKPSLILSWKNAVNRNPFTIVGLFLIIVCCFLVFTYVYLLKSNNYDNIEDLGVIMIVTIIVAFVCMGIAITSTYLKGFFELFKFFTNKYDIEKDRKDFGQMSQEEREEVREKRQEDIITNEGPIVSEDENYGGIKKM